jgi:hypothetical protein
MPTTPQADAPRCDVPGCGRIASQCTDGAEEDVQKLGRPAIKGINTCVPHSNWPHSDDAKAFALTEKYRNRVVK